MNDPETLGPLDTERPLTHTESMLLDELRYAAAAVAQIPGPENYRLAEDLSSALSDWTAMTNIYTDLTAVATENRVRHHVYAPPHRRATDGETK